jgi:hypothetical protein
MSFTFGTESCIVRLTEIPTTKPMHAHSYTKVTGPILLYDLAHTFKMRNFPSFSVYFGTGRIDVRAAKMDRNALGMIGDQVCQHFTLRKNSYQISC